jgi:hypothetical protein
MGRLSGYATEFARAVLLALKRFTRSLLQVVRSSANGIFPPIGIVSVVVLTALTAGVPTWGTKRQFWPFYIFIISGLLFGRFLWKTPREKYGAIFVRTFGWLPVFLGALSYGYWYWYASLLGRSPDPNFFHAAAEVLPVLLLATVVDVRRTKDLESKQLVLPIAAVFLGELSALNALAFGNAGANDFAAVASSFVSSIVALVLAVMADLAPSAAHELETVHIPSGPAPVEAATMERSTSNQSGLTPRAPVTDGPTAAPTGGSRHTHEGGSVIDPQH